MDAATTETLPFPPAPPPPREVGARQQTTGNTKTVHTTHLWTATTSVQTSILQTRILELLLLSSDIDTHPFPACATDGVRGGQPRDFEGGLRFVSLAVGRNKGGCGVMMTSSWKGGGGEGRK